VFNARRTTCGALNASGPSAFVTSTTNHTVPAIPSSASPETHTFGCLGRRTVSGAGARLDNSLCPTVAPATINATAPRMKYVVVARISGYGSRCSAYRPNEPNQTAVI